MSHWLSHIFGRFADSPGERSAPGEAEATVVSQFRPPFAAFPPLPSIAWMIVIRSEDEAMEGALLELRAPETVFGRASDGGAGGEAQHRFRDGFMSDPHAIVSAPAAEAEAFTIREREGRPTNNGTSVNGRRLSAQETVELRDGDLVLLGTTELRFKTLS